MEHGRLVEAGDEEKRARDALTYAAWGAPLSPEEYAQREVRLRAHPWSRATMRTWLLKDTTGQVLASCETFRMEARLRGEPGEVYAVASVFTEPVLRGRGHAERLMHLLRARLVAEPGRPLATVLFSDVGPALYARAGYMLRPAVDWRFTPLPGAPEREVDGLFTDADLPAEVEHLRLPEAPLVLRPSAAQLDWHLERERLYCAWLHRLRPVACGARAGRARAFWAATPQAGRLYLLLLDAPEREEAEALVRCARQVAHAAGLEEVRLWEDPAPPSWLGALSGGERQPRADSLPMLAPLAADVRAEDWLQVPRALWV